MNLNREKELRIFVNNEVILVKTPAQFKSGGILVDGTLTLTSNHLIFNSNIKNLKTEMLVSEINSVKVFKVLGIICKGIKCGFNNQVLTFRVEFPKDWVRLILRQQKELFKPVKR